VNLKNSSLFFFCFIFVVNDSGERQKKMGALGKLINISLFFFFALMAINVPLLNGQILFPGIYPKLLTDLKDWYSSEFNDYLFIEKPLFFVGLVWHEIIFLLPLSIVNIYAILTSKSWFGTTSLLYGASFLTSMVHFLLSLHFHLAQSMYICF